jgi:hypothetical protein
MRQTDAYQIGIIRSVDGTKGAAARIAFGNGIGLFANQRLRTRKRQKAAGSRRA